MKVHTDRPPTTVCILLILSLNVAYSLAGCSKPCTFYEDMEQAVANCVNVQTSCVPELPAITKRLDLRHNLFNIIKEDDFKELPALTQLVLANNAIEHIEVHALRGLKELEKLDLSANQIKYLHFMVFQDNPRVRELNLRDNPLQTLLDDYQHSFLEHLPYLEVLDLHGCALKTLPGNIFSSQLKLQHLDLSRNSFETLSVDTLLSAKGLPSLFLAQNPWKCDCGLLQLVQMLQRGCYSVQDVPMCSEPSEVAKASLFQLHMYCPGQDQVLVEVQLPFSRWVVEIIFFVTGLVLGLVLTDVYLLVTKRRRRMFPLSHTKV